MAYIPDGAVKRAHELPQAAFRLYAYYCMRRDHETGVCFPSLRTTAADMTMSYTYASEMRTALRQHGWITIDPNGDVRPVLGFETVRQMPKDVSANAEPPVSANAEEGFGKSRTGVRQTPKQVSANAEIPYIEPAQLTSPINQPIQPAQAAVAASGAKVVRPARVLGTRIDPGFQATESTVEWARENAPLIVLAEAREEFVDYWVSRSVNPTKADWQATFRNRLRVMQKEAAEKKRRQDEYDLRVNGFVRVGAEVGKAKPEPKRPPGPMTDKEIAEVAKTAEHLASEAKPINAVIDELDSVNGGWLDHADAARVRELLGIANSKRLESHANG